MSLPRLKNLMLKAQERLASPVSDEDAASSWTQLSKEGLGGAINGFILEISNTGDIETIYQESRHIVHRMDHWGITSGTLFDLLADIQFEIRELHELNEKKRG